MARQIAVDIARAFSEGKHKSVKNTRTDGKAIYLHGHKIIERREGGSLWVTLAGWNTVTTRSRINDTLRFLNVPARVSCVRFDPVLNGASIYPDIWYQVK